VEEVGGVPPGPFADVEVIREEAAMPISGFRTMLGIPRCSYTR